MIGMVLCLLFFSIIYIRCRREFQISLPIEENASITNWITSHPLKRSVSIRQSSFIAAPLTYGVFHPVILLPKKIDFKNTDSLIYILSHEYVHIKRFDAATKIIVTAVFCIHWFNPFVWLMYILYNRDIELYCDERVVYSLGETTKSAYALTLINMEERKNKFSPLGSHFSKNAIEERITAIVKIKKTTLTAIITAAVLIIGVTTAFATSAFGSSNKLTAIPDTNFSQEEYNILLKLQFNGYQDMSVAKYREMLCKAIDEKKELLERFNHDRQLWEMRFTNDTADFLYNTVIAIAAEDWLSRDFSGSNSFYRGTIYNGGEFEYRVTRNIILPKNLTVKEHDMAVHGIINDLSNLLKDKSKEELQEEEKINEWIQAAVIQLKKKWNTKAITFDISYFYTFDKEPELTENNKIETAENNKAELTEDNKIISAENDKAELMKDNEIESIYHSKKDSLEEDETATKKDYESLLELKVKNCKNLSVYEFNDLLLEWANQNEEASDRISRSVAWNRVPDTFTKEERNFITLTTSASRVENTNMIYAKRYGTPEKDSDLLITLDSKRIDEVPTRGEYALSYHILDKTKLTISQRDTVLLKVLEEIQTDWNSLSIEQVSKFTEIQLLERLQKIANKYSTDDMQVTILNVFYDGW